MGKKQAVRRITAGVRSNINLLVDVLTDFLPLTSPSPSTVTFHTIFKESKADKYFGKNTVKRKALQEGFENVYRYRERLIFNIIRKVIPAAIEYRKYKRNPLKRGDLEALAECLYRLNVEMRREIKQVRLDETLPRITVPPKKLKERLQNHDLVPEISSEPLDLFLDGHFNEAVRKSVERFEAKVQEISGDSEIGRPLMAKVFSEGTYINLDGIEANNQSSFQEGYKFLTMGAMQAVRNIFSHGDEEARSPEECFEMILFVNWLFRYLKLQ